MRRSTLFRDLSRRLYVASDDMQHAGAGYWAEHLAADAKELERQAKIHERTESPLPSADDIAGTAGQ